MEVTVVSRISLLVMIGKGIRNISLGAEYAVQRICHKQYLEVVQPVEERVTLEVVGW